MEQQHLTEAACLLNQGALYRKRIGLETPSGHGDPIFAGFKRGAFSLYFGDAPIYHFDLEGRWQRAFIGGTHYLKGLDAEVHAVDRIREGPNLVLHRRRLSSAEAGDLDRRIRSVALDLLADLGAGRLRLRQPPTGKAQPLGREEFEDFLERVGRWDDAAWFAHRERYLATYGPLPFLPPDCLNAVVLQATRGNAGGRSFAMGRAAEFHARTPAEFEQHTREVASLWGRRLSQSRVAFLAGSDALSRPVEDLSAYLDAIRETFRIRLDAADSDGESAEIDLTDVRLEGIHAFLDDFAQPRPDRVAWSDLAARGLVRISLGVESGHPAVRSVYGKCWADEELRACVADLKEAGLAISLMTLVGAGGIEVAEAHLRDTVALIMSLDLRRGDHVFLLDENEIRDPSVDAPGMTLLERPAWSNQQERLKEALAPLKSRGVKVLPYTLDKQWA